MPKADKDLALKRELKNLRRRLLAQIRRLVAPHLRESGYRTAIDPKKGRLGGTRPMLLWARKDREDIPVRSAYYVDSLVAITELGPITDAHGGGCVTEGWGCFPVEDLASIRDWLKANLGEAPPKALPEAA